MLHFNQMDTRPSWLIHISLAGAVPPGRGGSILLALIAACNTFLHVLDFAVYHQAQRAQGTAERKQDTWVTAPTALNQVPLALDPSGSHSADV